MALICFGLLTLPHLSCSSIMLLPYLAPSCLASLHFACLPLPICICILLHQPYRIGTFQKWSAPAEIVELRSYSAHATYLLTADPIAGSNMGASVSVSKGLLHLDVVFLLRHHARGNGVTWLQCPFSGTSCVVGLVT